MNLTEITTLMTVGNETVEFMWILFLFVWHDDPRCWLVQAPPLVGINSFVESLFRI